MAPVVDTSAMEESPNDVGLETSGRSAKSYASFRGKPELADEEVQPPHRRPRASEAKVPEDDDDVEQASSAPSSSARSGRTKLIALEEEVASKKLQAPAPPSLRQGRRYLGTEPGAVAVNGEMQRRRLAGIDDDTSIVTNTPALGMMDMSSSGRQDRSTHDGHGSTFLSTLTGDEEDPPIIATIVEHNELARQESIHSKNLPCSKLLRDRRVVIAICVGLLTVIGLILGLTLSNRGGGGGGGQKEASNAAPSPSTLDPSPAPTEPSLEEFIISISPDSGAALRNATSPQHRAIRALENMPGTFNTLSEFFVKQKYASQVLRFGIMDMSGVDIVNPFMEEESEAGELDECSWPYIECNNFTQVVVLEMSDQGLAFTIPEEIAFFSQLEELIIHGNSGVGTLPTVLGSMHRILGMSVGYNLFTGTIPTEIATMAALSAFDCSDCALVGTIPTEFGLSTTLDHLAFAFNQITGRIPSEIFANPGLRNIIANGNLLEGSIPSEIGSFLSVHEIEIKNNKLTGTLPTEIGILSNLEVLNFGGNLLNGTLPTQLEKLTQLVDFHLSHNEFTGPIPVGLTLLPQLRGGFSVTHNFLTGTIHTEFGRMRQLTEFALGHNKLNGTIPTHLGLLTQLGMYCTLMCSPFCPNCLSSLLPYLLRLITTPGFQKTSWIYMTMTCRAQSHPNSENWLSCVSSSDTL